MTLVLDVAIWAGAGAAAVLALALLLLTGRRVLLYRPVGTFAASLHIGEPGAFARRGSRGWAYGVGRYHGDRIEWFRVFSLSARPKHVIVRRDLTIVARRCVRPEEPHAVPAGSMIA